MLPFSGHRAGISLIAALALAVTSWPVAAAGDGAEHGALRPEFECVTSVSYVDGVGNACRIYSGHMKIFHSDGVVSYSHGPDPAPTAAAHAHDHPEELAPLTHGPRPVHCVGASSTSYYVHVIYSRPPDKTDRYATMAPSIRTMVENANGHLYAEAQATGGQADFRVLCSGTTITVSNAVLSTNSGSDSFNTITTELRALGYDNPRHKYWVWHDDGVGGFGGQGTLWGDDRRIVDNYNNGAAPSATFAITYGFDSWSIMMHELGHNLGAVQSGWQGPPPPGSNGLGHCNDGLDVMCYAEGGQPYDPTVCTTFARWDCNKNTYFHTNPPSGSYLASWWNIGWNANRYIFFGGSSNTAPTMTSLTCSPNPSAPGQTVSCSFSASDDSSGVFYTVNWGDGSSTTRVPSSGFVSPGTSQSASHAYASAGSYTISVTATDNASPALTSSPMTRSQSVQTSNTAPTMTSLTCSPNPSAPGQTVSCSFSASDDSSGVFYTVNWGDGSGTTRVPASGYVSPGTTQSAGHAYAAAGSYTISVTATDNGSPALTSSAMTRSQSVQTSNAAPTMTSLTCSPNPSAPGQSVSCSFSASDDSSGVFYTVDWGDGSATTRVPASGYVAPGTTQSASHAFAAAGSYTIGVRATDNASPALTSAPMTRSQTVQAANAAPTMQSLTCSPNPSTVGQSVTCSFSASDDSSGVFYTVDWGDGGATTRVPASGTVAPGTTQSASRSFAAAGFYTIRVTATDNASPALTSAPMERLQDVRAANTAPEMWALHCAPSPSLPGEAVTCSFYAIDSDSSGVHYTIDWGDGSTAERVPPTGYVTPGAYESKSHVYAAAGTYTVSVTATDNASPPLTSAPKTHAQTVQAGNQAPAMQSLSCAPDPSAVGATVTCTFHATDDSSGVYYMVDWGDGAATRVPSSGFVAPGSSQSATHAWSSAGSFTVGVTATDDGVPSQTSSTMTRTQTVQAGNQAPVMQTLSCSPATVGTGQTATCSFYASDDSGGVFYVIDWGDGSSTRVPPSGTVAPGTMQSATHAWSSAGTFTVAARATDDASPPLTSADRTTQVSVQPGNAAPVMASLSCAPDPVAENHPVTCSFRATDDSPGVYYLVTWGDGSPTERVPASGYVAPGATMSRAHAYASTGTKTVSVVAVDDASPPLTSAPMQDQVTVQPPTCGLSRTGSLTVGLGGTEIEGVSSRTEHFIPDVCGGRYFTLSGSVGSDFNVCWYAGSTNLGCATAFGPDTGLIPEGTTSARIVYFAGVGGTYSLSAA